MKQRTTLQLNKKWKRVVAGVLCMVLILYVFAPLSMTDAKTMSRSMKYGKTISLDQAKSLAISNSAEYASLKSKLALAQAKYTQSVKSIQLKKKNQSTFRWSPLLSFKFPEKADLADEFEYMYEPISLQSDIDTIKHQMTNNKYTVYEKVSLLFVKCYTLQQSIAFTQERIDSLNESLAKNKSLQLTGQANASDIDKLESNLKNQQSKLLSDTRNYDAQKEKLTDYIGLDVRSGYTFLNPYVTAEIDRSQYDYIVEYAEERDETLYEARVTTSNALIALDTNKKLMSKQYGSKMEMLDSFIQQAKSGEKIDTAAFKLKYDEFLKKIDDPWTGSFRILFIKIPKEWKKGEIDGVRYVEDEPYALYESVIDYQDALINEKDVQKSLEEQLRDGFNNYISIRQTYTDLAESVSQKEEEVKKATSQNLLGRLTYDELSDLQTEYEELQIEALDALSEYTTTLAEYDKLSCGAISSLLARASITTSTADGGNSYIVTENGDGTDDDNSYIVAEDVEGVYYYIHALASDNSFEFGLCIPDNFSVELTHYELWINGTQIGERTPVDQTIKHLGLDFDTVDSAFVRFYNGNKVVDDCSFDPESYSDKLIITSGYKVVKNSPVIIATYSIEKNQTTGLVSIGVNTGIPEIKSYDIKVTDGTYLAGVKKQPIDASIKYLGLISQDIGSLTFCFYDAKGSLLYECKADTSTGQLTDIKNTQK